MNELSIKHTNIFTRNLEAYKDDYIYIINQGGTRSSKSYSILQVLIYLALTEPDLSISIVRGTFPATRVIMKDFFDILRSLDIYTPKRHNKTEHRFSFPNGSYIEFFAIVGEQNLKGRKRDILYCNEANEIGFEEFMQLKMRTSGKTFIDFNPSDTEHWIYDLAKTDESKLIKSTYLDNTFLGKDQIAYIENLINVDENYYKIYTLGEPPTATTRIYSHFKLYSELPEIKETIYGLDFGYNHPTAMVKVMYSNDGRIFIEELLYKSGLTVTELINEVKFIVTDMKTVYCDSARPEIIDELRRNHINARGSDKNVKAGIDTVKSSEIYMDVNSVNLQKEYRAYSWKSYNGKIIDEPVKLKDDLMDALRYPIHTNKKPTTNKAAIGVYTFKPRFH